MNRMMGVSALALAGVLWAGQVAWAAEPPLNDSVRNVRDLREIALSPDGHQVAAVIAASTAEGGQTHLWLSGADGKPARQVTRSTADDQPGEHGPAWAKDGANLFFLAKRDKANRLYRLPMAGGEAQALVLARPAKGAVQAGWELKGDDAVAADLRAYEIAPNDRWIAVVAADGETAARAGEVKKKDDAVRVGRDDGKTVRLYLVDAATGAARAVELPDNVQSARWNPASDQLLVVTAPEDEDLGPAARLWIVRASTGAANQVAAGVPKTVRQATWAGIGLVYLAQCEEDAPPGCAELFVHDLGTGKARGLTKGLTGTLTDAYVLEAGGKSVVMPIFVGVDEKLARIDLVSGAINWIEAPQPVVAGVAANPAETAWAFTASGPLQPPALYMAARLGEAAVKLDLPPIVPADWPAAPSERVTWTNGALKLQGLLYQPKGGETRPPLVVIVHGGPSGLFVDRYSNLANLLVAQGWAVLETNPRGSQGYGAAFEAANKNDLGGGDYTDIMTGVDTVLAKYSVDPARMALIGYSYGGEMAAFVEGRTDRFKALVSGAPVIDQFSEYGTEDSSFYDRWYFGKPWDRFADAWRQSPLAKVTHGKTPMLLLQGEDDPTDPLGQSQEMYRALRQVGVPVELITYPRETHRTLGAGFSAQTTREPWHGQDLRRRMIAFIADAFAGKDPAQQSSPAPASAAEKPPAAPPK